MTEQGPVSRYMTAEEELRIAVYQLEEVRRVARKVIEKNDRLVNELAEARGEVSALELGNGELEDQLEAMARAERERDRG